MSKAKISNISSKGKAYFKRNGGYNEVTTSAIGGFKNDARSALNQMRLAQAGRRTAAAVTLKKVLEELSW